MTEVKENTSNPLSDAPAKKCPLCQSELAQALFVRQEKSFVRCHECRLIYQEQLVSPEMNRAFYEKDYYQRLGELNTRIQQARIPLYQKFFSEYKNYRRTGHLLDIGSGYGDFLRLAKEAGWEGWGIEPSKEACETARRLLGNHILNQTVEESEFPENHFDVVTLWNVIDCVPDPVAVLRKVRSWLTPEGILVIRTPNAAFHLGIYQFYSGFSTLLARIGWKKDPSVFLRSNFDAVTIRSLLLKAGFSNIRIQNGEPTQGDPYRVSTLSHFVGMGKDVVHSFVSGLSFLSGQRLMIGSNLKVQAARTDLVQTPVQKRVQMRIRFKTVALNFLAVLGYLLGLPVWLKLLDKKHKLFILLYHSVDPFKTGDMNVHSSQFEKQLRFLKNHYEVVSLEEVVRKLKNENPSPFPSPQKGRGQGEGEKYPSRPALVITFDDGYEDNYRFAYPILKQYELTATIFLLAGGGQYDRKTSHLGEDWSHESRLLTWDQIREMVDNGFSFGSHGQNHSRLKDISYEALSDEVMLSKEKIEAELKRPVRFFSYPYGTLKDFGQREESLVKEAGYEAAFSATFGTNSAGPGTNSFALRRIGIEASDTLFTLKAKLNGALSFLSFFSLPFVRQIIRGFDAFFLKQKGTVPKKKDSPLLLVSVDFPPHTDGVSTIARELAIRTVRHEKEIFVLGPKDRDDRRFDSQYAYRAFRVPGYDWGYLRFIPICLCMPWLVFRYGIRKIFVMNIAYGGILSWALSFFWSLDYLIYAYGYEFEKVKQNAFVRGLYLKIYGRAKSIICCSAQVRERLIQFGVPADKVKVLYPAADLGRYYPREVPKSFLEENGLADKRIILTVGRLVERKGHDRVLKALPEILKQVPNTVYCIVGIGPNEEKLKQEVRSRGLENHVRFFGKISGEALVLLYNACDVFVMPSREIQECGQIEGFGIVYLEANACGKPVIGGNSGGVTEAIRDGETGFLVDPNSSDDIAEKIIYLLSHPVRAKEMGQRGLDWVRKDFDWKKYVEESYFLLCGEKLK